ncbi:hypothetical protein, conserved [Plasmodium gonderi]|uniref:Iron-sulfur assembly protein n=1 Tax=Plasmodium gonderi TaxID=77519 RepID=A0A1Y1JGJ9_PLAGO|nr:hypothetical protein, conserved [Plasmodium gonderi]GAW81641.1 hypothetical protein, conserved [Plasmodium gonderi]
MVVSHIKKASCFFITKYKGGLKPHWSTYKIMANCNYNTCVFSLNSLNCISKRHISFNNNDLTLDWENAEDITDLLFEEYKNIDPLTLRFEELEKMVVDTVVNKNKKKLSGRCNESVLENIQMNWLEKYNEENN